MAYLVKPAHRAPAVTERIEPDPSLPRTCVIGAGSSGIAAAKALYLARVPFDCFEAGTVVGGNWVFDNPNGTSACYRSLEINTSCPRMAYSDFPMPEYYPHYARHWEVREYFERYVDHFGFRHTITFGTRVEHVARRDDGVFAVTVDGPGGREVREYDAVLVCNGHHWDARWPEPAYPGEFDGEQIHAHDYREAEQLAGRDVVVVGMGNSAMDIAADASWVASSTTISVRRGQWVFKKMLFGRPSDQTPQPPWLPWRIRRKVFDFGARMTGDLTKYGLPLPDHRPGESHPVQGDRFLERLAAAGPQRRMSAMGDALDQVARFVDTQPDAAPDVMRVLPRFADALDGMGEAAGRTYQYPALYARLGGIALRAGSPDEGETLFRRALALDPHQPAVYANLVAAVAAQWDDPAAAIAAAIAESQDPLWAGTVDLDQERVLELMAEEATALQQVLPEQAEALETFRDTIAAAGD